MKMAVYKFYFYLSKFVIGIIVVMVSIVLYTTYQQYMLDNGTLSEEKYLEIMKRMDDRKEFMKRQCSKLGLNNTTYKANAWEYLINRQYHVIWCNIFKAASTSWLYNFNLMANYSAAYLEKNKEVPLALARKKYVRPTEEALREAQFDSVSFLIVRHPLERLASAFNDKIAHAWPKSYYHSRIVHLIIKKYRKRKDNRDPKRYLLFEEFVSFITDKTMRPHNVDMHWMPYSEFCTPCKFKFDVILKFETLNEDQKYLIQMAQLPNMIKPKRRNSGRGPDTLNTLDNLYSHVNKSQLDALYEYYKNDFLLFNYTIDSYYGLIKNKTRHSQ